MPELYEEIIFHGKEERNIEYKRSLSWKDPKTQNKIIISALAMSNIRDGGYIVIGVEDKKSEFVYTGMTKDDYESFEQDNVMVKVNEYADPYVSLSVEHVEINDKLYVVIVVNEFEELPNICKKNGDNLKRGDIYIRPYYKFESTNIFSQTDMRDLLSLALDKMLHKTKTDFIRLCPHTEGGQFINDTEKYDNQIKELRK